MFISDNFKLYNNKFIQNLQKFVFTINILALIGLILYLFDVSIFNIVFCDNVNEINNEVNNIEIYKKEEESLNNNSNNKDLVHVISNIDGKDEEYISIKKNLVNNVIKNSQDWLGDKIVLDNISIIGLAYISSKAATEAVKH